MVDDVEIEEVGLMNVVRRKGAPLTVRDEGTGIVYEEGTISRPSPIRISTFSDPRDALDSPASGKQIQEGARLRVSYYHGTTIYTIKLPPALGARDVEIWKEQFHDRESLFAKALLPERR